MSTDNPNEWLGRGVAPAGGCRGGDYADVVHSPALQHDPRRPEDVLKVDADEDGVGGDDAADCLRYLVATKGRVVKARKPRGV